MTQSQPTSWPDLQQLHPNSPLLSLAGFRCSAPKRSSLPRTPPWLSPCPGGPATAGWQPATHSRLGERAPKRAYVHGQAQSKKAGPQEPGTRGLLEAGAGDQAGHPGRGSQVFLRPSELFGFLDNEKEANERIQKFQSILKG